MDKRPLADTIADMQTLRDSLGMGDSHATVVEAIDWLKHLRQHSGPARTTADSKGG